MSIVIKRTSRLAIAIAAATLLTMLMTSGAFANQTNEQNAQNDAYADNVSTAISGDANAGILSSAQSGDADARSRSSQRQSVQQNQIGVNVGDSSCDQTNRQNVRNNADAFNDSLAMSCNAKR